MLRRLLVILHAALGFAAIGAGLALALDPSGDPLSFEVEWLDSSPFDDYRVPGVFLAVVIGNTNLGSAIALFREQAHAPLVSLATGVLLLVWIATQTLIIGLNDWTQIMWIGTFLVVTALAIREVRNAPHGNQTAPRTRSQ